jgi:hypothetical protein
VVAHFNNIILLSQCELNITIEIPYPRPMNIPLRYILPDYF